MEVSTRVAPATASTPPSTRADPATSFDTWMLQKLRLEWSSHEFGGLLTPSKLAEARASFPHLETPIKVRLLLSLLSVRRDEAAGKKEVAALLQLADKDAEEWVKVTGGLIKQFLVLQGDGQSNDSYLHAQLEATASKVVQTLAGPHKRRSNSSSHAAMDDFFSLENGLLNPSLRPQLAPTAATHFKVSGEDDDVNGKEGDVGVSPVKKPLHRPQMARPEASSATSTASTRLTPAVKPPVGKKKNLTELSSEIRRKADAGRFKRQRSRISMIDINEVKQIESEKAQKAEERKKQKLVAKEKEKERAREKEKEKNAAAAAASSAGEISGAVDGAAAPAVVNDEHAAIAADIFAMHQQPGPDESMQQFSQQQLQVEDDTEATDIGQNTGGDEYVPDGTQALLNAAFHSTQDIMKEVVSQQNQHIQEHQQIQQQQLQPPTYQDLYRTQQQMQMHHLAPPQQQYHQGFEPEDASINNTNTAGMAMGFGGYNYGSTAGYYGDQFGNYGNAFGTTGYGNSAMGQQDNSMGLPPLGGRQLGFDPTQQQQQHQQQNNGGYMGGSGEYWR
ncbi:hypothetical protein GN958_ATG02480 [Phytophthora infestans]|uniref:NELF-A N-terminal domain-containing protein n=1 Tax=Phytophthora infestans TaxID=4787 RepID=A0A8S9VCN9_PHYIN|nr:hypothetical protein GN958_ATG02480 [Phytophthora infestans]